VTSNRLSLERELGQSAYIFREYVGDFDRQPAHLVDAGGAWRSTTMQRIDFHFGFSLNRATPAISGVPVNQYFGIGYSLRLDRLFGRTLANSP
jgi:hypothetical protein